MARILSVSLCVLLLLSGCTRLVVREIPDDPQVVVDTKDEPLQPAAIEAVRVSAPKNIVDAAHQVLGDEGSLPPKKDLTIDSKNKIKIVGTERLLLTLSPSIGYFSGSFYDTANKRRTFKGVLLQEQNIGLGLFQGNGQTGTVELDPAQ